MKALIVKEGRGGNYDALITMVRELLERRGAGVKVAEVAECAESLLQSDSFGVVIFVPKAALEKAKELKSAHSSLRVVALVSVLPQMILETEGEKNVEVIEGEKYHKAEVGGVEVVDVMDASRLFDDLCAVVS